MAGDDRSGKTEFDCPDDCPDSIVVINLPPDVTYADIRSYFLRNDVEIRSTKILALGDGLTAYALVRLENADMAKTTAMRFHNTVFPRSTEPMNAIYTTGDEFLKKNPAFGYGRKPLEPARLRHDEDENYGVPQGRRWAELQREPKRGGWAKEPEDAYRYKKRATGRIEMPEPGEMPAKAKVDEKLLLVMAAPVKELHYNDEDPWGRDAESESKNDFDGEKPSEGFWARGASPKLEEKLVVPKKEPSDANNVGIPDSVRGRSRSRSSQSHRSAKRARLAQPYNRLPSRDACNSTPNGAKTVSSKEVYESPTLSPKPYARTAAQVIGEGCWAYRQWRLSQLAFEASHWDTRLALVPDEAERANIMAARAVQQKEVETTLSTWMQKKDQLTRLIGDIARDSS